MQRLKLGMVYHKRQDCKPEICAAHRPSRTNLMRTWKFHVRLDKYGLMERFCKHHVGHPDPDSLDWMARTYTERYGKEWVDSMAVHGCCGCCR